MKNKLVIIGIVLIFLTGLGVLSYPLISSAVNNFVSRSQAENYTVITKKMTSEENQAMFNSAKRYNDSLTNNVIITDPFDQEAYDRIGKDYQEAFNVDGQGLIGYIDIPKINAYLPVRHSTNEDVLAHSAGHLQNTSLPIGGNSTHAVISAHSAYPSETFFDYLTSMEEGDEFYVHVLDRTLKYEVDQIKVVLPENTNDLRIVREEDYVTLVTCTPYSINTHRLLVRGKRVEFDDSEYIVTGAAPAAFTDDYIFFLGYRIPYWVAITAIVVIVAIIVFLVVFFTRRGRKKKKHLSKENAAIAKQTGGD